MNYIEPEMEIIEFSSVQTIIDASQTDNITDPEKPDVNIGF